MSELLQSRSIVVEGDSEIGFDGPIHLYNHLNYLFRTDDTQKWTGSETNECWAVVPSGGGAQGSYQVQAFVSRARRRELHDEAFGFLKADRGMTNLSLAGGFDHAFAFTLFALDEAGEPVVDASISDFFTSEVVHRFRCDPRANLICLVCHVDQARPNHLHGLFTWDGRKPCGATSRILDVLRNKDT